MNRRDVEKLATKRYGGRTRLLGNKSAPTFDERVEAQLLHRELNQQVNELLAQIEAIGETEAPLRKAARFAVDVDGDEPSWSELAAAVAASEKKLALREQHSAAKKAMNIAGMRCHGYRWRVLQADFLGGIGIQTVLAQGDTLEEVAAKLTKEKVTA